jgi:hypothetical protein
MVAASLLAAAQQATAQQYMGAPNMYGPPPQQAAYAAQMQAAYPGPMPAAYAGYVQAAYAGQMQAPYANAGPASVDPTCQGQCSSAGAGSACADSCCQYDWRFYGDFLYMRARNAEVPYAIVMDGPATEPATTPVQIAPYSLVDPDYEPAFRVGFSRAIDDCSSIGAQYTRFESDTADAVSATAPQLVRSLLIHPSTWDVASDGLTANANYGIDFQLADVEYRYIFYSDCRTSLILLGGATYANLEQDFSSTFGTNGQTSIRSDINFDGGGLRIGLEGERYARNSGLMVYGRSSARFIAGEFRASHFQGTLPGDPVQVDTGWDAGRIVTILDLELGVGWSSYNGLINISCGYLVSGWFNTVKMSDWITAVQENDLGNLGRTITFDGVTARAEVRF